MEIEDLIDQESRLKQGIFFTKHHIVDQIIDNFDFTGISSVIDSAAGSCNFLIPLAKKFPHISFYGIEKNITIYKEIQKEIKGIKNLKLFYGDALLDNFPIPKCDLYIGNPPFINFSDLDEEYREKIKPIWLSYFPDSKGFKMLLGDSRGDIAQLMFSYTVDRYLKDRGEIGVILPDSLIKGNSASKGFREFNNINVDKLVDLSYKEAFDNTSRNCFYILGKSGEKTTYPIKYITNKGSVNLIKAGDDLIEEGFSILKPSPYVARQGINTLGANSIFFFKNEPPFTSKLIKPLLKSSDIDSFSYKKSYKVLYPYKNGKLIDEAILKDNYPAEYNYLLEHKEKLENRKSRFAKKSWYTLFGIGEYTEYKYKVVWRGLGAKTLMASVTEDIIPNQAMNCYISTEEEDEANYICGVMNSKLYKNQLSRLNEEGAKSFAQPNTINKIYIEKFSSKNSLHIKISSLSKDLHKKYCENKFLELNTVTEDLYRKAGFFIDH